jgi:hypothetical protein
MWIVRLALRRPYTFVVVSMLIALLGIGSAIEDAQGHLSVHQYSRGHDRVDLQRADADRDGRPRRDVCERALTTTVNDMEHTESGATRVWRSSRCTSSRR